MGDRSPGQTVGAASGHLVAHAEGRAGTAMGVWWCGSRCQGVPDTRVTAARWGQEALHGSQGSSQRGSKEHRLSSSADGWGGCPGGHRWHGGAHGTAMCGSSGHSGSSHRRWSPGGAQGSSEECHNASGSRVKGEAATGGSC